MKKGTEIRQYLDENLADVVVTEQMHRDIMDEIMGEKKMKKKISATLVFALVMILIAGVALAYASARLGLMDALLHPWGNNAPSETLLESIIPLDVSMTVDDVKITLTDVAYDGNGFFIGCSYENIAPGTLAMVICESIEANGKRMDIDSWVYRRFRTIPDVFGGLIFPPEYQTVTSLPSNPVNNHIEGVFNESPGLGEWLVKATFLIKHFPSKTIVVDTDTYIKEIYGWAWDDETGTLSREASTMYQGEILSLDAAAAYDARLDQIRSFGISVAEEDERDPEMWIERGYLVINSSGQYYGECEQDGFLSEYFEEFYTVEARKMYNRNTEGAAKSPLEEVSRVTLEFTLDSDQAKSLVEVYEPEDIAFPLDVCSVRVREVTLSPLVTTVEFVLESLDNDWSFDMANKIQEAFGGFELTDQDGNPLSGWGMAYGEWGGDGAVPLDEEQTRWVRRYEVKGPGLNQKPVALRIITTDQFGPADPMFPREGITDADIEAYLQRKEIFNSAALIPLP